MLDNGRVCIVIIIIIYYVNNNNVCETWTTKAKVLVLFHLANMQHALSTAS